MCNAVVNWTMPHFSVGEMYFAALQSNSAKKLLPPQDLNLDTVVYYRDGLILKKSDAFLYLLKDIGGLYKVISIMLRLVPRYLRDLTYDSVAKNRYLFFKKLETCRLPSTKEKLFFLD